LYWLPLASTANIEDDELAGERLRLDARKVLISETSSSVAWVSQRLKT